MRESAFDEATHNLKSTTVELDQSSWIKLGIDVHQDFYVVAMQVGQSTPKPAQRFKPEAFLRWAGKLVGTGASVHAVYEACGFGFWLYRRLRELGVNCHITAAQNLDEANKRVKTDKKDARALVLRLDRYLQGNRDALAIIRVPTELEEQARSVHRQREQLLRSRKSMEAQGRSLLVSQGYLVKSRWWKERAWQELVKELPNWLVERLSVWRPVLSLVHEKILALTKQLEADSPKLLPKGVGVLTAVVLQREISDWHRFSNRRQVASYTGLCPSEYSSGKRRLQGSVNKHGNPRVRRLLVELAWRVCRFQPHYRPVLKWTSLLAADAKASAATKKKAIVAIARQLSIDLWRIQTGRLTAEQLGLIF